MSGGGVNPRVSVIMSVHNGADHLGEAVDSILGQTFRAFELIVIDDGSTDESPAIAAQRARHDARVRVQTLGENVGLTRALNRGLELARGELIARQDADDVSAPGRLAAQAEYLDAHGDVAVLGTGLWQIDEAGNRQAGWSVPLSDTAIRWVLLFHNPFVHTSVMMRREALEAAGGGYDESLPCSQDMELWGRLLERGRGVNLTEPLVGFRRHAQQISVTRQDEQQRIATEISTRHLKAIGAKVDLTATAVGRLRSCFGGVAEESDAATVEVCPGLFCALDALAARPGSDAGEITRIRRETVQRLARSVESVQLMRSGLWRALLAQAPATALGQYARRMLRGPVRRSPQGSGCA